MANKTPESTIYVSRTVKPQIDLKVVKGLFLTLIINQGPSVFSFHKVQIIISITDNYIVITREFSKTSKLALSAAKKDLIHVPDPMYQEIEGY